MVLLNIGVNKRRSWLQCSKRLFVHMVEIDNTFSSIQIYEHFMLCALCTGSLPLSVPTVRGNLAKQPQL